MTSDDTTSGAPSPDDRAREFAAAVRAAERQAEQAKSEVRQLETAMSRRDFLGFVLGATGGAVLGGLVGWGIGASTGDGDVAMVAEPTTGGAGDVLVFYPRVRVASVSELEVGQPVSFEYPLVGQTAALVKLGKPAQFGLGADQDIVAFSTKCTHMGWPLDGTFDPQTCVFGPCPGHFSTFDAAVGGQVVLGQATQRLPQLMLALEDDAVYAEGVVGLVYGYRSNLLDGEPVEVS